MARLLVLCALATLLLGCKPEKAPTIPTESTPDSTGLAGSSQPGTVTTSAPGDSGGISTYTPSAVPNAPVMGADSVQGGGSAAGTVAKDRARGAAAKAGAGSLGQAEDE